MKSVLLALAVASSLLAADSAVTDGVSNGRAWNGMAVEIKFVYLVGLSDGLRQAQGEIVPALFSKPAPGQEEKAAEITPSLLPVGKDFPTMIVALDEFYGDAQNLDIPIAMASRYEEQDWKDATRSSWPKA